MFKARLLLLLTVSASILLFNPLAVAINLGDSLPQMKLKNADGEEISFSSLLGKVVYIDIWATWCPSCVQSIPWMSSLKSKFAGREFEVLAINVDDHTQTAKEFLNTKKTSLNVVYDPTGSFPDSIEIKVMPTSLLINKLGKVILIHEGFSLRDTPKLEAEIEKALLE